MNDDLGLVRGIRDDAPRADRARLAPGRQRLLAAMEGGEGRRRGWLRADWRFTALGAVTAVALAAVIGSQVVPGGGPVTNTAPAGPGQVDATVVLDRASTAAGAAPVPKPRTSEWIYTRTLSYDHTSSQGPARTVEAWVPYTMPDHAKDPLTDYLGAQEKFDFLHSAAMDKLDPQHKFQLLSSVHGDTSDLLRKARAAYPNFQGPDVTRTQADFDALTSLAEAMPADPEGLALVYKAIGSLPGIKAKRVRDPAGHSAFAVYLSQYPPGALIGGELLLDATTYAYEGTQGLALRDVGKPPTPQEKKAETKLPAGERVMRMKKGQVAVVQIYLDRVVVSGNHERP